MKIINHMASSLGHWHNQGSRVYGTVGWQRGRVGVWLDWRRIASLSFIYGSASVLQWGTSLPHRRWACGGRSLLCCCLASVSENALLGVPLWPDARGCAVRPGRALRSILRWGATEDLEVRLAADREWLVLTISDRSFQGEWHSRGHYIPVKRTQARATGY